MAAHNPLGLHNMDYGGIVTCVGHADSQGRRCRIRISQEKMDLALQIFRGLPDIAHDSTQLRIQLGRLADCLLCTRYHSEARDPSQKHACIQRWTEQMKKYMETIRPVKQITQSRPSDSGSATTPAESSLPQEGHSSPLQLEYAAYQDLIPKHSLVETDIQQQLGATSMPSTVDEDTAIAGTQTGAAIRQGEATAASVIDVHIFSGSTPICGGSLSQYVSQDQAAQSDENSSELQYDHEQEGDYSLEGGHAQDGESLFEEEVGQDRSQDAYAQQGPEVLTKHQIEQVKVNEEIRQLLKDLHVKFDRMAASREAQQFKPETSESQTRRTCKCQFSCSEAKEMERAAGEGSSTVDEAEKTTTTEAVVKPDQAPSDIDENQGKAVNAKRVASPAVSSRQETSNNIPTSSRKSGEIDNTRTSTGVGVASVIRASRSRVRSTRSTIRSMVRTVSSLREHSKRGSVGTFTETLFKKR